MGRLAEDTPLGVPLIMSPIFFPGLREAEW
jgi:hypothetical protein